MIAYEIQLRYVIRDKIQSEKQSKKNIFCWEKNFVRKKYLSQISSRTDSNQSELSRTNQCLSQQLSGIYLYIPQEEKSTGCQQGYLDSKLDCPKLHSLVPYRLQHNFIPQWKSQVALLGQYTTLSGCLSKFQIAMATGQVLISYTELF